MTTLCYKRKLEKLNAPFAGESKFGGAKLSPPYISTSPPQAGDDEPKLGNKVSEISNRNSLSEDVNNLLRTWNMSRSPCSSTLLQRKNETRWPLLGFPRDEGGPKEDAKSNDGVARNETSSPRCICVGTELQRAMSREE